MTPIEKRIQDVSKLPSRLSCLFYGRSGTGKTTIACSFPKPLLLIDLNDKGTDSVRDLKGVKVFSAEDWEDLEDIYWHIKKSKDLYKTVVLDTVSMMQGFAVDKITNGKKDVTLHQKQWGQVGALVMAKIFQFRDLPLNCVFLAQDRISKGSDEDDEETDGQILPEVGARVMPSVATQLNAAVNIIGNTFVRETITKVKTAEKKIVEKRKVDYCLRIGPHAYYTTKVRKPKSVEVPAFILDPTYEKLVDNLKE